MAEPTNRLEQWPTLHELKVMHVRVTLAKCGGNRPIAAKVLGVSLKTIYNLVPIREGRKQ